MVHCRACGKEIHETAPTCPHCGAPQNISTPSSTIKTHTVAGLWCAFLGGFGAHRFYLGSVVTGILSVLFFWTYIPAIVAYIDLMIIAFSSETTWANKYNGGKKSAPVHWSIKVLALLVPIVFTIGILAAIAIPAYEGYKERAQHTVSTQVPEYRVAEDNSPVAPIKAEVTIEARQAAAASSADADADADLEKCVDTHVKAFKKENGEDKPINFDVIQEWEAECATTKVN
jgi:TM2 domain-containing membrane protein YozV/Tfp pilus assembly major pilin PilA